VRNGKVGTPTGARDIAAGQDSAAAGLLNAMLGFSSGVGLVPEQAWEDPDLPASPYGSDPATASIGFADGQAAGSASPLTWAQAQELRLIAAVGEGHTVEKPAVTTRRYVSHGPPGAITVSLTAPAAGATLGTSAKRPPRAGSFQYRMSTKRFPPTAWTGAGVPRGRSSSRRAP
jgi:glucoamylase